jgi:macrodomain Ter protein organizer (MatP/YcbG family)
MKSKMETETLQKNETREELRARLKQKINSKRTSRTNGTNVINRKKSQNINNCFKKIAEILTNKNIENPEQIDSTLIETITNAISKEDLQLILHQMQENSKFKELLQTINDKWTNSE